MTGPNASASDGAFGPWITAGMFLSEAELSLESAMASGSRLVGFTNR